MSFAVECAYCRKVYAVDPRVAGKRVRCKQCGGIFGIPPVPSPAAEDDPFANDPFSTDALAAMEDLAPPSSAPTGWPADTSPWPVEYAVAEPTPTLTPVPAQFARPRRKRRAITPVGTDSTTPWLVLLFLAANLLAGFYATYQLSQVTESARSHLKIGYGTVWEIVLSNIFLFFALVTTLSLFGIFIASKIMKFTLADMPYIKAAGIAAVPTIVVTAIDVFKFNFVVDLVLLLSIVPLTFYVLQHAFGLSFLEALVSFGFAGPLYLGGQFLTAMGLAAVLLSSGLGGSGAFNGPSLRAFTGGNSTADNAQANSRDETSASRARTDPIDFDQTRLSDLKSQVLLLSQRRTDDSSREHMLAELASVQADVAAAAPKLRTKEGWSEIEQELTQLQQQFNVLPSERPNPGIFQPMPSGEKWIAPTESAELGPEISFRRFKFRPPVDALLDLRTTEKDAEGLRWTHRGESSSISIKSLPRQNPAQQRPWVATAPFMISEAQASKLLTIDAFRETVSTSFGLINQLPFTRISAEPPGDAVHRTDRWVKYVALDGNDWLIAEVRSPSDAQLAESYETSVRTLRVAKAGEPRIDPFAPNLIAPRLADDPEHAALILRRQGAVAEPFVIEQLQSTNHSVRREAAKLLGAMATVDSLASLRAAADSDDPDISSAARAAIRRLAPNKYDAIDEALADLKNDRHLHNSDALETLARATPDPARRPQVAAALEDMLLSDRSFADSEKVGKALSIWYTDKTAPRLLPLLDKKNIDSFHKHVAAMQVLGATRDRRAVMPILNYWLLEDKAHAVAALVQIGQPTEDAILTLKALWHKDSEVRTAVAEILDQIGTAKCMNDLARAGKDPRDPAAAAVALQALESVKARIAAGNPATKAITKPTQ